ncbi:MAG: glycine--tRNA ligase subunit beta [Candidatus Omnitrophica bacterium]|nr:glycine--tRNA ligase subunit beta [Candidatus Omnitrophota bacterium]
MKKNLVFEIGVEDLPSDCGEYLINKFLPILEKILKDLRIEYNYLNIFYTIRRIIIFLKEVEDRQKDKITEIFGPPLEICIDEDKKWTEVAKKFADNNKVNLNELKIFEKKGKKVIGIIKKEKGEKIEKIFNNIINEALRKFEIPRAMIWNESGFKFFRPIRYIFCIYGEKRIPIEIGGIKSSKFTYGHRVLSDRRIRIKDTKDYFDKILKNFVIFDPEVRKRMIEEQIKKLIPEGYIYENDLIKKIISLVEYPICGICDLPEKYKDLPKEIIFSIILNVKGIPIFDEKGEIYSKFIIVCDGIFNENIKEDYQKVIENKIEDAVFFMKQDLNKKPFIEYLDDLKNIVYHPHFGTIYDRVERIRKICNWLCENLNFDKNMIERINLLISLFKNDLATLLVSEFPSLQGIVGRIYAEKNGYDEIISKSIEEHYLPRFQGDKKPKFIESAILSIADRIETICSLMSERIEIRGDQDPFGIKRITTGMIEIIWDKGIEVSISELVEKTLEILNRNQEEIKKSVIEFILMRTENLLIGYGFKQGLRRAVISIEKNNLFEIKRKIDAIKVVVIDGKGEDVLIPFIRVANMLKQAKDKKIEYGDFIEELLREDAEKELYQFLKENKEIMERYYFEKKYKDFLEEMKKWKKPIDKFFDNVFVMVEDEKIRNNRLSLLQKINDIFIKFADFSFIPIKEVGNVEKI